MASDGASADAEGEGSFFGELFLNQSYRLEEKKWEIEGGEEVSLRMHVSTAACTDYDLTGVLETGFGCVRRCRFC